MKWVSDQKEEVSPESKRANPFPVMGLLECPTHRGNFPSSFCLTWAHPTKKKKYTYSTELASYASSSHGVPVYGPFDAWAFHYEFYLQYLSLGNAYNLVPMEPAILESKGVAFQPLEELHTKLQLSPLSLCCLLAVL